MFVARSSTKRNGKLAGTARAGLGLLVGVACVTSLPAALAAASQQGISAARELSVAAIDGLGAFTPASVDPKLMEKLRLASTARGADAAGLFRFTPAGAGKPGSRAVTVAVRVDPATSKLASIRKAKDEAGRVPGVDPVGFNLGMARGYQSFAQTSGATSDAGKAGLTLPSEIGEIAAPDLSSFTPAKTASGKSRLSAIVELEDDRTLPGSAPRTFAGGGERSVDVGGAYRVADNLRVTAGIRYSADRDRLGPLTDGQQDSQSVYVGTRFRF